MSATNSVLPPVTKKPPVFTGGFSLKTLLKSLHLAAVDGVLAEFLFDAQQLVVFANAVGT